MRMFRLLRADEIECRISEVDMQGRFLRLLLYKTARTDAALLDDKRAYYDILILGAVFVYGQMAAASAMPGK